MSRDIQRKGGKYGYYDRYVGRSAPGEAATNHLLGEWLRDWNWRLWGTLTFSRYLRPEEADAILAAFLNQLERTLRASLSCVIGREQKTQCGSSAQDGRVHFHLVMSGPSGLTKHAVESLWSQPRFGGNRTSGPSAMVETYNPQLPAVVYLLKDDCTSAGSARFHNLELISPRVPLSAATSSRVRRKLKRHAVGASTSSAFIPESFEVSHPVSLRPTHDRGSVEICSMPDVTASSSPVLELPDAVSSEEPSISYVGLGVDPADESLIQLRALAPKKSPTGFINLDVELYLALALNGLVLSPPGRQGREFTMRELSTSKRRSDYGWVYQTLSRMPEQKAITCFGEPARQFLAVCQRTKNARCQRRRDFLDCRRQCDGSYSYHSDLLPTSSRYEPEEEGVKSLEDKPIMIPAVGVSEVPKKRRSTNYSYLPKPTASPEVIAELFAALDRFLGKDQLLTRLFVPVENQCVQGEWFKRHEAYSRCFAAKTGDTSGSLVLSAEMQDI